MFNQLITAKTYNVYKHILCVCLFEAHCQPTVSQAGRQAACSNCCAPAINAAIITCHTTAVSGLRWEFFDSSSSCERETLDIKR